MLDELATLETQDQSNRDEWLCLQIAQLDRWMQELERCARVTHNGRAWNFRISWLGRLCSCCRDHSRAYEHARSILQEYKEWRAEAHSLRLVADPSYPRGQIAGPGKLELLRRIAAFVIRHPLRTCRQINPRLLREAANILLTPTTQRSRQAVHRFVHAHANPNPGAKPIVDASVEQLLKHGIEFPAFETPLVSIIVPVFNEFATTLACLKSIRDNTTGVDYEVILADDASTDRTTEIELITTNMVVERSQRNLGFLKNCNHAAKRAQGQYILLLNNDTHVQPRWLNELVDTAERDPSVGIVGPKFLDPEGELKEAGSIIWRDARGWNYGIGEDAERPEYNYVKEVDYISAACILIRKRLWAMIGGFDERYAPAYYEDADLALEVRKRGYKSLYQPKSVVVHVEGVSHGTDESQGLKRHQTINQAKFREKWQGVLDKEHFDHRERMFHARDRTSRKKSILVIDHYVPRFDKDTGSKSTFQYLRLMAESGLNVKFMGDNFYRDEPYTAALQQLGIEVLYGNWFANNWKAWLKNHAADLDYVYLVRPHVAEKYVDYIKALKGPKILYQGIDLHYLRVRRQYEVERDDRVRKLADQWQKKELSIFSKVDASYFFSDVEVSEIKKRLPGVTVRRLPLYVLDYMNRNGSEVANPFDSRRDLLFVGGFAHQPNIDGVHWFVEDILATIVQRDPSIKLIVIGSDLPKSVKSLASRNVSIIGEVSDDVLDQWYSRCRVSVVPLRYGAGIKGKVLEAVNLGVPVVTTDIGAEGLPEAARYLEVASDANTFASSVLRLYSDGSLWSEAVHNGREVIKKHFSKENALEVLQRDMRLSGVAPIGATEFESHDLRLDQSGGSLPFTCCEE